MQGRTKKQNIKTKFGRKYCWLHIARVDVRMWKFVLMICCGAFASVCHCLPMITEGPTSRVVDTGETVRFRCEGSGLADGDATDYLTWTLFNNLRQQRHERIFIILDISRGRYDRKEDNSNTTGDVIYHFKSKWGRDYQIVQYGPEYSLTLDLIVPNITTEDAGIYQCEYIINPDPGLRAHLIILDDFACGGDQRVVSEGETVHFDCIQTSYAHTPAELLWKEDNQVIPSTYYKEFVVKKFFLYEAHAIFKMTASLNFSSRSFVCELYWSENVLAERKRPKYNDTCVHTFVVQYSARDIEISAEPSIVRLKTLHVEPGSRVTCAADGNPLPTYEWYKAGQNSTTPGSVLIITNDMLSPFPAMWVCKATNIIKDDYYTVERQIVLQVVERLFPTSTTPTPTTTLPPPTTTTTLPELPDTNNAQAQTDDGSGNMAMFIGIGIGAVALLIITGVIVYFVVVNKRNSLELNSAQKEPFNDRPGVYITGSAQVVS